MPNWCYNLLKIQGTKNDIEQFYTENKSISDKTNNKDSSDDDNNQDQELDFYNSVPIPKEEEKNWYNWNIQNLGTKWNVHDAYYEFTEIIDKESAFNTIKTIYCKTKESDHVLQLGSIIKKFFTSYECNYHFDTAWSPPIAWLNKISEKYPNLRFKLTFEEQSCDFCGYQIIENSQIIDSKIESCQEKYFNENKDKYINIIKKYITERKLNTNNINTNNEEFNVFNELQEKLQDIDCWITNEYLTDIINKIYNSPSK